MIGWWSCVKCSRDILDNYCGSCGTPRPSEPKKGLAEKLRDCMLQSTSFMESERYQIQAKAAISHVLEIVESLPIYGGKGMIDKFLLIKKLKEESL